MEHVRGERVQREVDRTEEDDWQRKKDKYGGFSSRSVLTLYVCVYMNKAEGAFLEVGKGQYEQNMCD